MNYRPMSTRILFILHMPPPIHGASMVGKYIYNSNYIKKTFNPFFINLSTASSITDIGKFNLKKIKDYITLISKIINCIKEHKPQLVYVTPNASGGAFLKDFIIVLLLKLLKSNIVFHYHNKGVSSYSNKFIYNILYKVFFRKTKVILLSSSLYNDINKYVNRKNVYYCANGIPTTITEHKSHKNNSKTINILFLSNLLTSKGVYVLLDALRLLKDKGYIFKCNYIGSESKEIKQHIFETKISEYNLESCVKYCGKLYNEEKEVFFYQADIFVLPTFNDCFPLVLLEAMQHSLPCIASDEGAISNIIDNNITGYIIEKGNSFMLANKLEKLINDNELRDKMGKAGYNKFQALYTIEQFDKNFTETLIRICNDYDNNKQ